MLIKVYTSDFPGRIIILENVSDITIHINLHPWGFIGTDIGPESTISSVHCYDGEGGPNIPGAIGSRHVDFNQDGIRQRLLVSNYAYICNDQGKTIEKVSVR